MTSPMSVERLDWETDQNQSLHGINQVAPSTESCTSELGRVRRRIGIGVERFSWLSERWFKLCEFVMQAFFCALPRSHSFAAVDLNTITVSQETASFYSRDLLGEQDLMRLANSPALSGSQSNFAISWRRPWVYFVFLMLVWLLLF